jgi:uncharacterized protein (TIGR02449 family)
MHLLFPTFLWINIMSDNLFLDLETRIESLVKACQQLRKENHFLKESRDELELECEDLREKQAVARGKLEKIVEQLKTMELSPEHEI